MFTWRDKKNLRNEVKNKNRGCSSGFRFYRVTSTSLHVLTVLVNWNRVDQFLTGLPGFDPVWELGGFRPALDIS